MRFSRKVLLPIVVACALINSACPNRTRIERIKSDPARFANKEVAIAGRVTDSYGILGTGAYEIDDGTGRIWVVTRRGGVPSRGSMVGVKGRVYTGFSLGGRSFGTVLEESDRRAQ